MSTKHAKSMIDDLQKTWDDSGKAAVESARKMRHDAEKTAANIHSDLSDGMTAARDAASEGLGRAGEHVSEAMDRGARAFNEAADSAGEAFRSHGEDFGEQVARRPFEALLLAGAAGFALGYLMHRRA